MKYYTTGFFPSFVSSSAPPSTLPFSWIYSDYAREQQSYAPTLASPTTPRLELVKGEGQGSSQSRAKLSVVR